MRRIFVVVFLLICSSVSMTSSASATWDDGYWFLEFKDATGAALKPLNIGIDAGDGSGFKFSMLPDDDGDGVIHLPPLPDGGGLALGVSVDDDDDDDIFDLLGPGVHGGNPRAISRPLLIVAEDIEGEALGTDSDPFPLPPTRTLVLGERLTVTDGVLAEWPDLHLVAGPDPADMADFLRTVDTWPNFNGDVSHQPIADRHLVLQTETNPKEGGFKNRWQLRRT
jgi:hypothetical protein